MTALFYVFIVRPFFHSTNPLIFNAKMQKVENNVVSDVATRRKYATPEIEVIPLNVEGALLSASATFSGMQVVEFENEDE